MKLNFGGKKKSSDMLVLYITVGIVFILITVMNIYEHRPPCSGPDHPQ